MGIKLDKENPGTFVVSFAKRHPITRQPVSLRRKGYKSRAEASRAFNDLVVAVENKIRKEIIPTWEEAVEHYLVDCKNRGLTEHTIYGQEACLRAHTKFLAKRSVDTITTSELKDLLFTKLGSNKPSHQKYFLRTVRAVFATCMESGALNRNPTPLIKFKVGDKIKMAFTVEQTTKFLKQAREVGSEWYPHWAMALYTGMRNGELYALTWDKISLESRTILVNASWNNKNGFKDTKSGNDRIIEIADALIPLLRDLQASDPTSPWVLPRMERWDAGRQAHDLRMFLAGMGLPPIRFHDLRATWATLLLGRGVAPIKVMKMGGWKDMETMMIYARNAGVDIRGTLTDFKLHEHQAKGCKVLSIASGSSL